MSGYLPHPLTNLIGREDERLEVAGRLRRSRLVTLIGPGGIGKTRLAVAVAEEAVMEFPDGAWLVTLEALSEGAQVARQIAGVLELKEAAGRPLQDSLTEYLRPKRLLLVLDNCEHLLKASAQITGHLLRECAGIRVLATSREALGITGETVWGVPALAVPDPAHLPTERATLHRVLLAFESVQLFIERCEAIQGDLSLSGSRPAAVAQICAQLGGIPLAIELAAARTRVLTVEQIAARLNDHLGLLTGGSRVALPRHQTLQATLDWSYELLSEAERVLLARLSVFAGCCDLEAAESVCTGEGISRGEVLNLLTALIDKSLVALEKSDSKTYARYRLQETVRQYALKRLEASGAHEKTRTQHRDYFLELAEEAVPELSGAEQGKWLDRLQTEYDNLRAALAWSAEDPLGATAGLRIAGALGHFWFVRGPFREGRQSLKQMLEREGVQGASAARAKALSEAGTLAEVENDYSAARMHHEESLEIRRALGDRRGVAESLDRLSHGAIDRGEYLRARALLEESLSLRRELGDRRGVACCLANLGNIVRDHQIDYTVARALYEESLSLFREMGDRRGEATALTFLGGLAEREADNALARRLLGESLPLLIELQDRTVAVMTLLGIAAVMFAQAKTEQAACLLGAVDALGTSLGTPLSSYNKTDYDRVAVQTRSVLGADAFERACVAGRALTWEQMTIYALANCTTGEEGIL